MHLLLEFKTVNKILLDNNLEAPEIEVRIGKFGVKDDGNLNEEIKAAIHEFQHATIIFADLDNFKEVNDNFSHSTGDAVIKSALDIATSCIESKGELFHRSGDEMVILLPDLNKAESLLICEDFRGRIENCDFVQIGKGVVTTTIGVASFPEDGKDEQALIEIADQRAMAGKRIKKNSVYGG